LYTPFDFHSEADFIASSAVTRVAVFYNTGGVNNGRIFRFPLRADLGFLGRGANSRY